MVDARRGRNEFTRTVTSGGIMLEEGTGVGIIEWGPVGWAGLWVWQLLGRLM